MDMKLRLGDTWEAYHALIEQFSEAGGTSNRYALQFKRRADKMKKRLEEANVAKTD